MKNKKSSPAELNAAAEAAGIAINNIRNQVAQQAASVAKLNTEPDGDKPGSFNIWVNDVIAPAHEVGETWCSIINAADGKTYEQDFTIESGTVKLVGDPREVIANVTYDPVQASADDGNGVPPQPRKGDGKFHSAASASEEADGASNSAKTKPEHEAAAKLHDTAAKLHADAGNAATAKRHREKATSHRDQANALTAESAEVRSQKSEVRSLALEAESLTAMEAPDIFAGFMAMAGGVQTMTLGCTGKPVTVTIDVNAAGAKALQAQLETVNKATPQKAFNCFFHEKKEASSWPKKFFWQSGDGKNKPGIYEAAEPSGAGLKAVKEKTCRGFSLTFFTDAQLTPLPLDAGYEILPGAKGSPENPAQIVCPEDVAENPNCYLNMGTLTNRPASVNNQPLFASQDGAEKNLTPPVAAPRQAGAHPSVNQKQQMKKTKQLDAAALQDRKTQLEQRIATLEAEATDVAKEQLVTAQYELEETETLMELAASNAKITAFETEKQQALEASAQSAVEDMIESQQIPALDKELQASWKSKFTKDPTLIPLIVKKTPAGARRFTNGATAAELQASKTNDVEFGFSVPLEMKQLLAIVNRNTRIRILPGMSKAQMEAAYEEKGKLALQAGLLYKKSLKPNLSDWKDIPFNELGKCVGLDASAMVFSRRAFEAADYNDPNNQLQTLSGTLVLQRTLPLFAYDYPELNAMFTDFSDAPGLFEQTEMTRVVNIPAVQLYNAGLDGNGRPIGFVVASPASTVDAPLTLSAYIAVPIVFSQATLSATNRRPLDEQAAAGMKAIASYFAGMVTVLLTPANYNGYAAVTAPDANGISTVPVAYATYAKGINDWSMTDLDKLSAIFTQNKVPRGDRGILLNPQYYAKLRSDPRLEFFFAASKGDPQLMGQKLPDGLSGFMPYEAPYLPQTNNLAFFPFHKAAIMLKSRLPMDFTQAVSAMVPGSITTVTEPDSKFSVALVQRVDLVGNYAEWRPEVQLGANVGDKRGGLPGTTQ